MSGRQKTREQSAAYTAGRVLFTRLVTLAVVVASSLSVGAGPLLAEMALGDVTWSGVRAFEADDLAGIAKLKPGVPWVAGDSEAARGAILETYRAEGFIDAAVEMETVARSDEIDLNVRVNEGPRYRMGTVHVEGEKLFSYAEVMELCPGLQQGAAFSKSGIENSFDLLLREYGERGYAECRVSPRAFSPRANGTVDFTVEILEGTRYSIEAVDVKGGRTRGQTAGLIAGLKVGAPFDPWDLEDAHGRLASSGLFSRVGELWVRPGSADSLVVVQVDVDEAPSSSVSGLLGYSGKEGGAVGFVDLRLGNILGTARSGSFRWENSGGGLSTYGAYYREPWLGGMPVALEFGIDHVAQDTTYSTTGISGGIQISAGRRLSLSLGASKERTAVAGESEGQATRRSRVAVRAGVEVDARDNAYDPHGGLRVLLAGDWGSRTDTRAAESKSWRIARLSIGAELHRRIYSRHGLFLGAQWRKVISNEEVLPWDQLLRFGGANSLRGYREDQFRAEETSLLQLEHRIGLGAGGSRLFFFTDFGVLGGHGAPQSTLVGYGLGIRAASPGGVVGLDYGLGKGDSWSEGKVHVRLTRTF
jgi:outer membrane protein insertion porin family